MPARIALTRIESCMEDTHVGIKDVHIGEGGEARSVYVSYDEVKRRLCVKIYELGGTEVLQELYLANGRIFVVDRGNDCCVTTDKYLF